MTTLQEHEAKRPAQPRPIKDMTPTEYKKWSEAMSVWLWERDGIIASEAVKGMDTPLDHRSKVMMERACTPRADYEYREIPKRKSRAKKPAWSGATAEYMAQKKREQRDRERQARAVLIRAGLAERKNP